MVDNAAEDEVTKSKICCSNEAILYLCWRDVNRDVNTQNISIWEVKSLVP